MSVSTAIEPLRLPRSSVWPAIWIAALAVTALLYLFPQLAPWAVEYPKAWIVPVAKWTGTAMLWIRTEFTWLTRALSAIGQVPLDFALDMLARGFKIGQGPEAIQLPRLSWLGVVVAMGMIGWVLGGRGLAALAGGCFLYIALFGQWDSAMLTLGLIVICVPLCVVTGLLIGIWGYRNPRIEKFLITPVLDVMQTMPTFAYLVPMLLLFGNKPVSAMMATGIFAVPPMVRATMLALQRVPQELDDFGVMAGCTRSQKLWRVLLPAARPTLLVGLNQVIMLALNMVIISSMIGAGGLGYDVLLALRALNVGAALEAGLAIVALAIALDRLSQAAARQRPVPQAGARFWERHPYLTAGVAILMATTLASLVVPGLAKIPESMTISSGPIWKSMIDWVTQNFFDVIEAFRTWMLLNILNPIRDLMAGMPWLAAAGLIGLAGFQLGGFRLLLLVVPLTLFCAITGLWDKTMATIYLCGISTVISALIGIPLGVLASRSDRADRIITPIIDTLQTMPSFVFIIPTVMLFRVGDVTAMIAIVSFAVVPAIRYTNLGLRQVSPALIEAAKVSGCTRQQMFWRVQLPLALPEIMLGINQTILLALSMLIITAMIGTRDLGQEVFIALAKADAGRGLIAGLTVAFIGITADRLIGAWSRRARQRLGLT